MSTIEASNQDLDVLYEDSACMVINKPAGISVHPGHSMDKNEETLLSGIAFLFQQRDIPFSPDAVLVHRLDKPTTGCLLVAKDRESFVALQKQFEDRSVEKTYLAVVQGVPENPEATIDAPVGRNLMQRTKMSILRTSVSRDAQTTYQTLDGADDVSLLACTPHTGRTHQIRVHLSSIGHPILGDENYASPASKTFSEDLSVSGLCLHAWKLKFVSPDGKKEQFVEAPFSATISQILDNTGLRMPRD